MSEILTPGLRERLRRTEERVEELGRLMSDPATVTDRNKMRRLGQELAQLEPVVAGISELRRAETARAGDNRQAEIVDSQKRKAREEQVVTPIYRGSRAERYGERSRQ